jgi:branched-subunit amino acid transport protein
MKAWIAIVGVAAVTFLLRASFIVFADPHRFPAGFRRALLYVPPSVLASIVAPGLLVANGALDLSVATNPRWIAGVIAIVVAAWTRSAAGAIGGGMAALWLIQWGLARL